MLILGVETSTLTGSVALIQTENETATIVGEITLSVSLRHSESLLPAVQGLLENARIPIRDVDLFAVSHGPGSFTGLRIGIAAAQGLSLAHDKPLVGISALEGLALNGAFFPGLIVPLVNAYRGEIYRGMYKFLPRLEYIDEDRVMSPPGLVEDLRSRSGPFLFLGNGVPLCQNLLQSSLKTDDLVFSPSLWNTPRGSSVAFLASQKKSPSLMETVLPHYLRLPG